MLNVKKLTQSVTNCLVIITVVIHLVVTALFAGSHSGLELFNWQTPNFAFWQLITYMFLHADYWHLGLNMFALWSLGNVLEQVWGKKRLLIFYLVCGFGAAIISQLIDNYAFSKIVYSATVGASGAIYGILVAFALFFPNFKLVLLFPPIPIAAKYFVPVLLLVDLTAGLTGFSIFGANIAHFAHIGGAFVGFLLVRFWLKKHQQRIKH